MDESVDIVVFVDEQFSERARAQYSSAWESAYKGCNRAKLHKGEIWKQRLQKISTGFWACGKQETGELIS